MFNCRYVSDCRSRGCEFDPGLVPYFHRDAKGGGGVLGGWQGPKFNFFRKCHVAYQIKGNEAFINLVANILSIDPLPGPWSKGQNSSFSEHGHFAYQIKGNDECSIFCPYMNPRCLGWGQSSKLFFF